MVSATASRKKKKVICDPILNTINSNKEMRELAGIRKKSKTVSMSWGLLAQGHKNALNSGENLPLQPCTSQHLL